MLPINEEDIACIRLQDDVCATSSADSPRYLIAVRRKGEPPVLLGEKLNYLLGYEVIGHVCRHLAPLTVDGTLRVNNRRIAPDAYIRRWRQALEDPLHMEQFARAWRVRPVATIQWSYVPAMAGTRPYWLGSPFPTFGELLMSRHTDLRHTGYGSRTSLEIDLTSANGPRDAWWASDWVHHLTRQATGDSAATTAIHLHPCLPAREVPLALANRNFEGASA